VRQFFEAFIAAFPDLRNDLQDVFASGDKVVARVRVTGTNQGEFMGMPATGKSIDLEAIDIVRFGDGKAVEHWGAMDGMEMMQQLGAVPGGAA
jgi:predicted ester cyclase